MGLLGKLVIESQKQEQNLNHEGHEGTQNNFATDLPKIITDKDLEENARSLRISRLKSGGTSLEMTTLGEKRRMQWGCRVIG